MLDLLQERIVDGDARRGGFGRAVPVCGLSRTIGASTKVLELDRPL